MARKSFETLQEGIDTFIQASTSELKSPKTILGYIDALQLFLDFCGNIPISDLTEECLQSFVTHETERRREVNGIEFSYSLETIYKRYSVIKTFVRWLYQKKYISKDPSISVQNPKRKNDAPDYLSEVEIGNIFKVLNRQDFRDLVIFETFLFTGIRLYELAELKLTDLDFETGHITIAGVNGRHRTIPLGTNLMRNLQRYIYWERKSAISSEKALFLAKDGTKLEVMGIQMMIKRLLSKAGVKRNNGPQLLRNTFARKYLQQGGSLNVLRKIMGHSNINVTARYSHLMDEDVDNDYRRSGIEHFGR